MSAQDAHSPGTGPDASAVSRIAELVRGNRSEDIGALGNIRAHIPIGDDDLAHEVLCLRTAAAHFAMYTVFRDTEEGMPMAALDELYAQVDPDDARGVRDRDRGYAAAMTVMVSNQSMLDLPPEATDLHFTEDPASNVGKLFAHFCEARRDPIVGAAGAVLFAAALNGTKEILS